MSLIPPSIADRVELAILRADAPPSDVHAVATEVIQRQLAGVVVAPVYVARVATMLRGGSGATVTAAVSYPDGTSKPTIKAIEATSCIKDGADAILVTAHAPHVLRGDFDAARSELLEIARAARATRRDVMIRVRVAADIASSDQHVMTLCRAVRESGCDALVVSEQDAGAAVGWKNASEGLQLLALVSEYPRAAALLDSGLNRVIVFA